MHPDLVRHREELERLCRQHRVRRLELFGSAAVGLDRPGKSDFDFLVEFEPLPPGEHFSTYFGLRKGLEDLLKRPIDLVETTAITNPYFRESVDETRVLVYAA